jgi:hypothetical protein
VAAEELKEQMLVLLEVQIVNKEWLVLNGPA